MSVGFYQYLCLRLKNHSALFVELPTSTGEMSELWPTKLVSVPLYWYPVPIYCSYHMYSEPANQLEKDAPKKYEPYFISPSMSILNRPTVWYYSSDSMCNKKNEQKSDPRSSDNASIIEQAWIVFIEYYNRFDKYWTGRQHKKKVPQFLEGSTHTHCPVFSLLER